MKFKIIFFNEIQNQAVLHLAAQMENLPIVKLLLIQEKADINIKDSKGKKPIDYSKNPKIKQLLSKEFQRSNDLT